MSLITIVGVFKHFFVKKNAQKKNNFKDWLTIMCGNGNKTIITYITTTTTTTTTINVQQFFCFFFPSFCLRLFVLITIVVVVVFLLHIFN